MVAADDSELLGGRWSELASPESSSCSTRRTAGTAAQRAPTVLEAWLASPPSPPEDAKGAVDRLLIDSGVAELEVEAAIAIKTGGEM